MVAGGDGADRSGSASKDSPLPGELNSSAQSRWLKTIEVFNEQGEAEQLKLFPAQVEAPEDDPQVARVLVHRVRDLFEVALRDTPEGVRLFWDQEGT